MFLEVKTNPYFIVIQRKTKRGLWENISNISTATPMSYNLISNFIYNFWNTTPISEKNQSRFDEHVRAVIIGEKSGRVIQVLSSDGLDFYDSLQSHKNCYLSVYMKNSNEKILYTDIEDTIFNNFEDFHQLIISHHGIKKARMRPPVEADNWLITWDITFNDNIEISLSFLEAC